MDQLYLLRHGIAVPTGTEGYADSERPLTPKGERRMRQQAQSLRKLKLKLDRIVSSPLIRAYRSAEILAEVLGIPFLLERDEALRAGESAASIKQWLQGRKESRLLIVGHDPAFSELVGLLTIGKASPLVCELRKGGIAALRAHPDGSFALDWLARPRLLRRLG